MRGAVCVRIGQPISGLLSAFVDVGPGVGVSLQPEFLSFKGVVAWWLECGDHFSPSALGEEWTVSVSATTACPL